MKSDYKGVIGGWQYKSKGVSINLSPFVQSYKDSFTMIISTSLTLAAVVAYTIAFPVVQNCSYHTS